MKRRCAVFCVFAGFAPNSRAPPVRSRREDHIRHLQSGHRLVLLTSCLQFHAVDARNTQRGAISSHHIRLVFIRFAGFAPTSRAPLVRSRREDHIPHLQSGPRLVLLTPCLQFHAVDARNTQRGANLPHHIRLVFARFAGFPPTSRAPPLRS